MRLTANGISFDTNAATLLQEHVLRQRDAVGREAPNREQTIGFERLYKARDAGVYWIHERFYKSGGGDQDSALPLSEVEARAWLKDRFGWSKRFNTLETRIFGGGVSGPG